jgi:hypothetical protein
MNHFSNMPDFDPVDQIKPEEQGKGVNLQDVFIVARTWAHLQGKSGKSIL